MDFFNYKMLNKFKNDYKIKYTYEKLHVDLKSYFGSQLTNSS